jgi:hypothetical protein
MRDRIFVCDGNDRVQSIVVSHIDTIYITKSCKIVAVRCVGSKGDYKVYIRFKTQPDCILFYTRLKKQLDVV